MNILFFLFFLEAAAAQEDLRVWKSRFSSSWMFERVNLSEPSSNSSIPMMSYGEFWYDWPKRRAVLTHDLCPLWLPSETEFSPWPCNTIFNDTEIFVVSNASTPSPSCCRWYNPWNATVTSPDWVLRANATLVEVSREGGFTSQIYRGDLPFHWRYGTRVDRPNLPYFLDHFDTPDEPEMASRWLLLDAREIDEFDESLFQTSATCRDTCDMKVPFPVPADDSVKYPHVENIYPPQQSTDSVRHGVIGGACPVLSSRRKALASDTKKYSDERKPKLVN